MMTKERYNERMNTLAEQFHLHRRAHSWRCASFRLRKMARLYSEYTGKDYDTSLAYLMELHRFTDKMTR